MIFRPFSQFWGDLVPVLLVRPQSIFRRFFSFTFRAAGPKSAFSQAYKRTEMHRGGPQDTARRPWRPPRRPWRPGPSAVQSPRNMHALRQRPLLSKPLSHRLADGDEGADTLSAIDESISEAIKLWGTSAIPAEEIGLRHSGPYRAIQRYYSENLEQAATVDFEKHPARKVGTRSRQCGPNPKSQDLKHFAIREKFSRNFPPELPQRPQNQDSPKGARAKGA